MADVRASSGAPAASAFAGLQTPSPGTPLIVDTATGKLYAMTTGDAVSLIADGARAALATNATAGFTYLATCAGTPTGVPAGTPTGAVPVVYDTTNNKLYAYNAAWKGVVLS